jgi:hypothetical protein
VPACLPANPSREQHYLGYQHRFTEQHAALPG